MKIYAPEQGFTKTEMDRGLWALYCDVTCTNPDCKKVYAASYVGGIGGSCLNCGSPCR